MADVTYLQPGDVDATAVQPPGSALTTLLPGGGATNLGAAGITGTWGSTEAPDVFHAVSAPSGTWGSTEAKDVFAGAGHPSLFGTLGVTEAKDVFAATGHAPSPAPVFVNSGTLLSTFGASITPVLPASLVNGNLLLALVTMGGNNTPIGTPAGWTLINAFNNGTLIGSLYYRFVTGGETNPTFTFTGGSTSCLAKIWQYSGVVTFGAQNIVPDGGNSSAFSNPGLTTTANNSLAVCLWYGNNGTVTGTPTGFNSESNELHFAAFDQATGATGSTSTAIVAQPLSTNMHSMSFELELCGELPVISASMGVTEAKDVWASRGSLIGGSWHSTEVRDTFFGTGFTPINATWGSTETKDIFAGTVFIPPRGTWGSIDLADTFAGTGTIPAAIGIDTEGHGGSHDTTSATVSLTTTKVDDVILLCVVTGGFFHRAKVGTVTDSTGLVWKKRQQRWLSGSNPSCELWWAKKAVPGALTITVNTVHVAGDPVGLTTTGDPNVTGFIGLDAIAIFGANADKPFDTHSGAGGMIDTYGSGNPITLISSNSTRNMAICFYVGADGASTGLSADDNTQNPGIVNTLQAIPFDPLTPNPGFTWLSRTTSPHESDGLTGTIEAAYGFFGTRLIKHPLQFQGSQGARSFGLMQEVIVGISDPLANAVSTNDVIRWHFDGAGQHQVIQMSGTNKTASLTLTTFDNNSTAIVAIMVQSALGARVASVTDDGGHSPGWQQRAIEVGIPGSLSLETWWCTFPGPFSGNITVTLDDNTQPGDIVGFLGVAINGADLFQRGEIWDGDASLPKGNNDGGTDGTHQQTGNFSSLNAYVLELNFAANTGSISAGDAGHLEGFNEDPWGQFTGNDFFGHSTGILNSSAPSFNISVQYRFSEPTVSNDHTEINSTPPADRWLMISDVMPVGPAIPPTGVWASVDAKDVTTHTGNFTAIGIASPGGWVGFPPNHAAMAVTDTKDRTTNPGTFTAIWDSNGWIGFIPAFMTLAFTDHRDAMLSYGWVLGPTTILARWGSTESVDRFGAAGPHTWYTTADSKGDRRSRITVTTNAALDLTSGPPSTLVDGILPADHTGTGLLFLASQPAAIWIQYDFGTPKVINEAIWFQTGFSAQPGLWVWQASNDASTWTTISAAPFVLDAGNVGNVIGDFSSNWTQYRYYRTLQTTNAGANGLPTLWEIQFKAEGFSGTMGVTEDHDRMNYQVQLIPKVTPIPARKRRLLIVT